MDSNTLSQESALMNSAEFEHLMGQLTIPIPGFPFPGDVCGSTQPECENNLNGGVEQLENKIKLLPADEINDYSLPVADLIRGPTGTLPSTEDYRGPYDFQFKLSTSNRCSWVFSDLLRKVFIDVNKVLLLRFLITPPAGEIHPDLRVRALVVYTSPDYLNVPVNRCLIHWGPFDSKFEAHAKEEDCRCKEFSYVGHVLTTDNEKACYEFDTVSRRHSVTVPLEPIEPGYSDTVVGYQFGCKTSCQGGMSRRPARILFTLETPCGNVVGRTSVLFKVCSCPKRDKDREENEHVKEKQQPTPPNPSKRKAPKQFNEQGAKQKINSGVPRGKILKIDPQELLLPQQQLIQTQIEQNNVQEFVLQEQQQLQNPLNEQLHLQQLVNESHQQFHYQQPQLYNEDSHEHCERLGVCRSASSCQQQINEIQLAVERIEHKFNTAVERIEHKINTAVERIEQLIQLWRA